MIGLVEILFLIIFVSIIYLIVKKLTFVWFYRIVYYISRQNGSPNSPFAIFSLLMILKTSFKKGLRTKTYENISDWNLVHEIGNRYMCSLTLYGHDVSFIVVADSLASIDFQNLDIEGLEALNNR